MNASTLKMKLLGSAFALGVGLLTHAAWADALTESTLVTDVDPPDTEAQFCGGNAGCLADGWTGSDANFLPAAGTAKGFEGLNNANPSTEENWLNALLGDTFTTKTATVIQRFEGPQGGGKTLSDYDPEFSWVYAVIKPDNYWIAVQNDGSNQISGTFNYGISHVTFFTPIPGAALLFGSALLGLWGFRRLRREEEVAVPA
jgi:hypothetical protein